MAGSAERAGDDSSVNEADRPVGVSGGAGVVRSDDDGDALSGHCVEQPEDVVAGVGVEAAGRFVGDDEGRPIHQCPSYGDALLLAAAQVSWVVVQSVTEAELGQELGGYRARDVSAVPGEDLGYGDVVASLEFGDEVDPLGDDPDPLQAQACALGLWEVVDGHAVEVQGALVGSGEEGEELQQGRLPGT